MYFSKKLITTAIAVMGIVGASVAFAAIPGAGGVINGCVGSKGALKVIDAEGGATCDAGEQSLAWNQQGPAGPQGAQGPQGPAGPQGLPGPSNAYVTEQGMNSFKLNGGAGAQTLLSMELPAGSYLVWATVSLSKYGDGMTLCTLDEGLTPGLFADNNIDSQAVWLHQDVPASKAVLMGPVTFARGGGWIKITCDSSHDPSAYAQISALKVGSLTEK
jgi:hypothetical protein